MGVIAAKQIISMTLDAEFVASDDSIFYLVGGLANYGGTTNEAFIYSFYDGLNICSIRHSIRISTMDLGIQGVSIGENVIWGVALSTG